VCGGTEPGSASPGAGSVGIRPAGSDPGGFAVRFRTPRRVERKPAVLRGWSIGRKAVLRSSVLIPDEKGQQVAQHCDNGCGRFDHKPVELVGIKPAFPPGVVSRSAGESWAGLGCDGCGAIGAGLLKRKPLAHQRPGRVAGLQPHSAGWEQVDVGHLLFNLLRSN
jgi:hypothetical protein